jgi:alginate O-acetyltransferase complex protein AlgI
MTGAVLLMLLAYLAALPLAWRLSPVAGASLMAAMALATVTALSPLAGLWLGATTLATPLAMRLGDRLGRRGLVTALWGGVLVALLLGLRDLPGVLWIGGAYFTLRHLHVLIDWWMGLLATPALADYARYQFFLPVMAAGPIHRFQPFCKAIAARRWQPEQIFTGAERALFGAFMAVVLGGWAMHRLGALVDRDIRLWGDFAYEWAMAALYWVELYFTFAGLASVAVGLALMGGLRIEENFNQPWRARNLVEFWNRWHITLSNWCRDYVFRPVAALTRRPALGVVLSMLAMGLWHGSSAYWLLWGLWQGLGLVLTRAAFRLPLARLPLALRAVAGPVVVFGWLTLSRPVIVVLLGVQLP